jgi:hypothetical protein
MRRTKSPALSSVTDARSATDGSGRTPLGACTVIRYSIFRGEEHDNMDSQKGVVPKPRGG